MKNNYFKKKYSHISTSIMRESGAGFIFLEIIVAIALISIVFVFLLSIGVNSIQISSSIKNTSKIDSLIKEAVESVRSFRNSTDWATNGLKTVGVGSGNPYYLTLDANANPPKWKLNSGQETIGQFARKIIFDKVSRSPLTGNIENAYNPSNDDPNTRKITIIIIFNNKNFQTVAYLTNWRTNDDNNDDD